MILIDILFFGEPTVDDLVAVLSEPEIRGADPGFWLVEPWEKDYWAEQGINWLQVARLWGYVYPNSGVFAAIGLHIEDEELNVPVYHLMDSVPPDEVPIAFMLLFPPMSAEEYYDSLLIYDWVRDLYP